MFATFPEVLDRVDTGAAVTQRIYGYLDTSVAVFPDQGYHIILVSVDYMVGTHPGCQLAFFIADIDPDHSGTKGTGNLNG
jgi:hypothetical protein